jgi:hypothetical protein
MLRALPSIVEMGTAASQKQEAGGLVSGSGIPVLRGVPNPLQRLSDEVCTGHIGRFMALLSWGISK